MGTPAWKTLFVASSVLEAEILKGALLAQEIPAEIFVEGAARYGYAINVGPLGEVQLCVPDDRWEEANRWLEAYQRGQIEPPTDAEPAE